MLRPSLAALVLTTLLTAPAVAAPKPFEGTIEFAMTYEGKDAAQASAFAPTGAVYEYREGAVRVTMKGGMAAAMMGTLLATSDGKAYMLKDDEKRAYQMDEGARATEPPTPAVTKHDEVVEIAGYPCTRYTVVIEGESMEVWATDQLAAKTTKAGGGQTLTIAGVAGVVLKKRQSVAAHGMELTTTTTASKVTPGTLDPALFHVPADWETKPFDPVGALGGG